VDDHKTVWFEHCDCRFCNGTLLGIVCEDEMFFITEFVREGGRFFVKLQTVVLTYFTTDV